MEYLLIIGIAISVLIVIMATRGAKTINAEKDRIAAIADGRFDNRIQEFIDNDDVEGAARFYSQYTFGLEHLAKSHGFNEVAERLHNQSISDQQLLKTVMDAMLIAKYSNNHNEHKELIRQDPLKYRLALIRQSSPIQNLEAEIEFVKSLED